MRKALVALSLLAAAFGASAQPYAPQEFDFSELAGNGANAGIVESAREVPAARDLQGFAPEVLEHKIRPDTVEELVVRLDGGSVITVTHNDDMQRLQPGQRVRVTLTTIGPLVEAQ
jgi:hypothetical protein